MVDGKVAFSKNVAKILYIEHKYLQITGTVMSRRRPLDLRYVDLCLKPFSEQINVLFQWVYDLLLVPTHRNRNLTQTESVNQTV